MNIPLAVILTSVAAFSHLPAATRETPPPPAVQQPARDIDTLVRELADESFRIREKATYEIWKLGETALPALKEAAASSDPEQAFRARDLLRKIQLHITPDTDPAVIALVERYLKASPSEKIALFGKLRSKRAWRQMLKLYASEPSGEVREKLRGSMNGVAVRAARERLVQGDSQGARELLELAPADATGLLALAEFHRSHGTLEVELNRAKAIKGPKSAAWQLALQRAVGNPETARDAASAAGETRIAAVMAALAGDPLPWLRENVDDDPMVAAYTAVAVKRWLGQKIRPSDLEPLSSALSSRNSSEERGSAINALFLLGEVGLAEPPFAKANPLAAFSHFDSLERIPEALNVLGIEADHPDFKAWVEKRLQQLTTGDIGDQHGVSTASEELIVLANFLERRGLVDDAFSAFSGPLDALREKHADMFMDLLGELFGGGKAQGGAPQLAKRIGIAWAGDDEKRWDELISTAFGEDEQFANWWDWLAEISPKASRAERFAALLALFDTGKDPSGLRGKWLALAWKAVEEAPAAQRGKLRDRISSLSIKVGDAANILKAWDQLPESERDELSWEQQFTCLSAAERWNDAATMILKRIALLREAKLEPIVELHACAAAALRKAGRPDEAAIHDQWVDKLALGSAIIAIKIGNGYAFGSDYKRAAEWWARAVREGDPDANDGVLTEAMRRYSDILMEEGEWRESAAMSEVIARIFASADDRWSIPLPFMRQRLQADTARALANLKSDRAGAIAILDRCHRTFVSDGSLADFFFPALRKVGLVKEHDEWFRETWDLMEEVIKRYPESDNTRNTSAWFASRALRKLDEAEHHLAKALASNPCQSAYLDTMAEIQFARGNRQKALEWSKQAVNFSPGEEQLRQQQERFRSEPLPK